MAVLFTFTGSALADSFDDKINALKAQAAQQQVAAGAARAQADSAQAQISQYQLQISALQTQINLSQAKNDKLNAEIVDAQAKMEQQKVTLAANLKSMYLDNSVTPLEMIASSNNLSEYFNQQQYQDSIKSRIQSSLVEIQQLKTQLVSQQKEVSAILADQKLQRGNLAALQQKAASLLAVAQSNAAAADQQVRNLNSEAAKLKSQQLAALAAQYGTGSGYSSSGACGGGYPAYLCNAGQDTLIDKWGMYNRECVSYTAFRVAASGRRMPYWGGAGNANQWPGNARAAGIPMDGNPRVGDVAISTIGPYGHAMYVEEVIGSKIHVSQYNYGVPGTYSEMTIPSSGLYFIHF